MTDLRKVQRTPTGTFFVCLPRAWADQNGLQKGTVVNLAVTGDGKLLVEPKYAAEQQPRTITLATGSFLSRNIIGSYLLGFDRICIESKERIDFGVRNRVQSTARSLIGLEIIEESSSQIVLQCLLEPSSFSPEKNLSRNHFNVTQMVQDACTSFINGDLELAKNVIARDDESNRLYFLLVRVLRTIIQNPRLSDKLHFTPIECLDYRLAASLIEGMGDSCVQLAHKTIALNGIKLSGELGRLLVDLQAVCCTAHSAALKAFLNKDIALADSVRNQRGNIEKNYSDVEKAAKESSVDMMPQILSAVSFLRRIYENSVDLADLVV